MTPLESPRHRRLVPWAAAALFALLAVVHTWPLGTGPGRLAIPNGDAMLNTWIVAWVAHQLPRDPAGLFDANIFYPAPDALAFSEPLIVPALLAAPLLWLGASPVLAHNLLLLAGLAATGLATAAVAFAWTRDRVAAVVAGSLFAFNTHTLTRTAHLQALHAYGLPLALLLADRLFTRPAAAPAVGLGLTMAMLAYTSGYLIVFATVMIAVAIVVRVRDWWPNVRQVTAAFGLAATVAGLLVVPLALPYRRAAAEQGMVRSAENVRQFSASPAGYLAATGRVHLGTWSARFQGNPVDTFFPGFAAAMLAGVAVWEGLRRRSQAGRVAMLCAIGLVGVVLSLGPRTPVYGWLFAVFPPMQGLRAAARFGNLFLLAIALLAALGTSRIRQAHAGRAWILAFSLGSVIAVHVEALRAPLEYRPFDGIPRIYDLLAREPGRVVLAETPFYPAHAAFENAEYVLNSTAHWRPLMNGYSGYTPASYRQVAMTFWYFPDDRAIDAMKAAGVTHVTVHPRKYGHRQRTFETLARRPDFELLAISAGEGIRLYRLR